MLTPDSQYMYISACRSNERVDSIARDGNRENRNSRRSSSGGSAPMQTAEKARNAAVMFAARAQRRAFRQHNLSHQSD